MSYFCHQRINFQLQLAVNLAPARPIRDPWGVKAALLVKRPPKQCCCSVAQSCPIRCDSMDCSMPGFPVHHHLLELAQIHVHRVGDAIQPSLLCPFLLLPSIFPSIRVFSNESTLCIRWPKYWNFSFIISPSNEYSMIHYNFTPQHIKTVLSLHTNLIGFNLIILDIQGHNMEES